jgi:hypothetical protein
MKREKELISCQEESQRIKGKGKKIQKKAG